MVSHEASIATPMGLMMRRLGGGQMGWKGRGGRVIRGRNRKKGRRNKSTYPDEAITICGAADWDTQE